MKGRQGPQSSFSSNTASRWPDHDQQQANDLPASLQLSVTTVPNKDGKYNQLYLDSDNVDKFC